MPLTTIVILISLIVLFFYITSIYNKLVSLKTHSDNLFLQIEIQLRKGYDLIPNLIETANEYLSNESEILDAAINARNDALATLKIVSKAPNSTAEIHRFCESHVNLGSTLQKLNSVIDTCPELKSNDLIFELLEEITNTESNAIVASQNFNEAIQKYNTYRQSIPTILFAGFFGHKRNGAVILFSTNSSD